MPIEILGNLYNWKPILQSLLLVFGSYSLDTSGSHQYPSTNDNAPILINYYLVFCFDHVT